MAHAVMTGRLCAGDSDSPPLQRTLERLGVACNGSVEDFARSIPFGPNDTTVGCETELQAAVQGSRRDVDLPRAIESSAYYANTVKHARRDETSFAAVAGIESWLAANNDGVWDNSWVRLDTGRLNGLALSVLEHDLLADKSKPAGGQRLDAARFRFRDGEASVLRTPVSYLIKLALAHFLGEGEVDSRSAWEAGWRALGHFSSDNTSPETCSLHITGMGPPDRPGLNAAHGEARRFLLTQLLAGWANQCMGLSESGQRVIVCASPMPSLRQRQLSRCVSDSFYRDLFMSPCLSGWGKGEEKQAYMHLCHEVLSRSQLNAVAKMVEAGIITRNLVVLPTLSNTSLGNNGVHVSMGSRVLTAAAGAGESGPLPAAAEKRLGDLVIKTVEHFLPLFVGTFSAAPARLGFSDFHPEKALGFLPHQLDYTHLRMFWRTWKAKGRLQVLGRSITPLGPERLDGALARLLGLRGDFVPDLRLLDYPVALLSTSGSPALNGEQGNTERLTRDLEVLGVFSSGMACYLPMRLRTYRAMGYCGFEGRIFSLFPGFERDFAPALVLQNLLLALAMRYIARGDATHRSIPDEPHVESERRQVLFCAAMKAPHFYVHRKSRSLFMRRILGSVRGARPSRRYPSFLKVRLDDYLLGLINVIRCDGPDLIEALAAGPALEDLGNRLKTPGGCAASARLTTAILREAGARRPLDVHPDDFAAASEKHYRESLRIEQIREALEMLEDDLRRAIATASDDGLRRQICRVRGEDGMRPLRDAGRAFLEGQAGHEELGRLLNAVLICCAAQEHEVPGRPDERGCIEKPMRS